MEPKHPLALKPVAPAEIFARYDLRAEAPPEWERFPTLGTIPERVISAHAPYLGPDRRRLNIASTDDEVRRASLDSITGYIRACARFPNLRVINLHAAPRVWYDRRGRLTHTSSYERLLDGLRELAAVARHAGWLLVLENTRAYWRHEYPGAPGVLDGPSANEYYGTAPEEWLQIPRDAATANLRNCLDTSHAVTYAQRFPEPEREEVLARFLTEPHAIAHVHWNDNYLLDPRGRIDSHAPVGQGTVPRWVHERIVGLDATLVLEHYYSEADLVGELEFIRGL